ncbi:MAG TPA: hypothetical protein PLK00_05100 [Candidatus Hydrogenedentes bacterium]|nr:hypothetical protein [Candidatus Hydrogenedentota bacterium]
MGRDRRLRFDALVREDERAGGRGDFDGKAVFEQVGPVISNTAAGSSRLVMR